MPDIALIQGAVTGLKTAADIAKSFLQLKSIADVQGKVIELQSAILSAQSSALAAQGEQSSMAQRIRDLEEEIASVKAWKETKQRYVMTQTDGGGFIYALKENSGTAEPPHWICANCYSHGGQSVLQRGGIEGGSRIYYCPHCKTNFRVGATQIAFVK